MIQNILTLLLLVPTVRALKCLLDDDAAAQNKPTECDGFCFSLIVKNETTSGVTLERWHRCVRPEEGQCYTASPGCTQYRYSETSLGLSCCCSDRDFCNEDFLGDRGIESAFKSGGPHSSRRETRLRSLEPPSPETLIALQSSSSCLVPLFTVLLTLLLRF